MKKFATPAAVVPEPCSVLGTALRPFCLGHHFLFKRLDLPFCGKPMEYADWDSIQIGISICGQEWDQTLDQLLSGHWPRVYGRWLHDLKGRHWRRLWRKRKFPKAFMLESETLFRAYLADGYQKPPIWDNDGDSSGIKLSAPWEIILKNKLMQNGHNEADVMRRYLPAAWYDYYTISELNAAKNCSDPSKWRTIFYTAEDHAIFEAFKPQGPS